MTASKILSRYVGAVGCVALAALGAWGCSAEDASPPRTKVDGSGGGAGNPSAGSVGGSSGGSGAGGGATGSGGATAGSGGTSGGGAAGSGGSKSTGAGGSGGSSGSSGSSGGGAGAAASDTLITDLEHGPSFASNGRSGSWYVYNDKTAGATQTPTGTDFRPDAVAPPRDGSTFAAHTTGSGFTVWGAGIGFDLNNPSGASKKVYDASAYSGITLWVKGSSDKPLRFNIATKDTAPEGGTCNLGDAGAAGCNDHFGTTLAFTADWTAKTILFADLTQSNFGVPATFKRAELIGVQFQVAQGATFDFWIDDVSFVK